MQPLPLRRKTQKRLHRWLASPWFSYGEFLQRSANHTCLIDIGIGAAFPGPVAANRSQADAHGGWNSTRVHTELELEMSLRQGRDLVQTVLADRSPAQSALFNRFAVFEHLNLLGISASYPCPGDRAACAADRPPRALWMYLLRQSCLFTLSPLNTFPIHRLACISRSRYDMVDTPGKPQPLCSAFPSGYQCNVLVDLAARSRFFSWCKERNVVELYIGVNPLLKNATLSAALESFVRQSDAKGIDIQFCLGVRPRSAADIVASCV